MVATLSHGGFLRKCSGLPQTEQGRLWFPVSQSPFSFFFYLEMKELLLEWSQAELNKKSVRAPLFNVIGTLKFAGVVSNW